MKVRKAEERGNLEIRCPSSALKPNGSERFCIRR